MYDTDAADGGGLQSLSQEDSAVNNVDGECSKKDLSRDTRPALEVVSKIHPGHPPESFSCHPSEPCQSPRWFGGGRERGMGRERL